ncbi:MAG: 4Fe-4S ferredoxin [Firmicutes bacterium]|nr:4Fe-4S ferredoxin [Bacillota bacterium]
MDKYFPKLRWVILILGFAISTFGVYIIGKRFTQDYVPVFICPINREGTIDGACYKLSHLNGLFGVTPWVDIGLFFLGVALFIVIFGRMLCGFLCPLGFIQDLVFKFRSSINGSSVIRFGSRDNSSVNLVKWGFLFVFFGICAFGINFCDLCPVKAVTPLIAGGKLELHMSFFVTVIVVVGSFFKYRFWCNVCPLGYFVGVFHKFSLFRLKKNCQACTECGYCYEACPMEIKSIYTERKKSNITTCDCLFCSDCIKVCPEDQALKITFLGKAIYTSSREAFFYNNSGLQGKKDEP